MSKPSTKRPPGRPPAGKGGLAVTTSYVQTTLRLEPKTKDLLERLDPAPRQAAAPGDGRGPCALRHAAQTVRPRAAAWTAQPEGLTRRLSPLTPHELWLSITDTLGKPPASAEMGQSQRSLLEGPNVGRRSGVTSFEDDLRQFAWNGRPTDVEMTEADRDGHRVRARTFTNEFWTSKQRAGHSLHEISYRACFKPQLVDFFVQRLTEPGDLVYDPFMGVAPPLSRRRCWAEPVRAAT